MLVKWEKFVQKLFEFLSRLPEKDMYISEQSRRYWLFKENMNALQKPSGAAKPHQRTSSL